MRTDSDRHRELIGDKWLDLDVESLTHLRPTGGNLYAAVEVNVDQGIRLVQRAPRKRNAEFYRHQR